MKKIIDGKLYNSDSAELIHSWDNLSHCSSTTDFNFYEEELYRTKNGAFFLHGVGGASSPYSQPVSGGRGGGEDIRPITQGDAIRWLEQHDGEQVLIEQFADHIKEA